MSLPDTYRRLIITTHSEEFRKVAQIETVPMPEPEPGQILIRNLYAGVNASDVPMAAGQYLLPTPVPFVPGGESVGEVVAVGEGVEGLSVGDTVLTTAFGCGYTEYHVQRARYAVPLQQASPEVMSLSVGGLTASLALETCGRMGSGETVLVTAAAGGTGQFAVQLAKLAGNHVIGTCSTEEKAELLRGWGCDRVINYREERLRDVLKAEYPKGVDIVFESVGGVMFDSALRGMAPFGRLITIGAISEYKTGPQRVERARVYYHLLQKNVSIHGFNLNLYIGKPVWREHIAKLAGLLAEGKLQPQIDPTEFRGVEAVIDAVEHLHGGKNSGKVVVRF